MYRTIYCLLTVCLLYTVEILTISVVTTVTYTNANTTIDCPIQQTFTLPNWSGPPASTPYTLEGGPEFNPDLPHRDRVSYASNQRSLVISNTQTSDAGSYYCTVGIDTGRNIMTVRIPPQSPIISDTYSSLGRTLINATEDQPTTLVCTSRGGHPDPIVEWQVSVSDPESSVHGEATYDQTNRTYTVTVSYTFTPTRDDDLKTYTCQSSYSTPPRLVASTTAELYLNLKPSTPVLSRVGTPVEGQHDIIIARCVTRGFRPSTSIGLVWGYNGMSVTESGSMEEDGTTYMTTGTYTYTSTIGREDNGRNISCAVIHPTLSSTLNVSTPVYVQFPPRTAILTGRTDAVVNGTDKVSLVCTAGSAIPGSTNIIWTRDGEPVISGQPLRNTSGEYGGWEVSQTLEFIPTRDMDGQEVKCYVANIVNAHAPVISSGKVLNLRYRPTVAIENGPAVVITEGDDVKLTCAAVSNPESNITWSDERGERLASEGNGNTLEYTMYNVERCNGGNYTCSASNGIGEPVTAVVELAIKEFHSVRLRSPTRRSASGSVTVTPPSTTSAIIGGATAAVVVVVLLVLTVEVWRRYYTCVRKTNTESPGTLKDIRDPCIYDELKHIDESRTAYDSLQLAEMSNTSGSQTYENDRNIARVQTSANIDVSMADESYENDVDTARIQSTDDTGVSTTDESYENDVHIATIQSSDNVQG